MKQGLRGWPGVWLVGVLLLTVVGRTGGQAVGTTNEVRAMRGLGTRDLGT